MEALDGPNDTFQDCIGGLEGFGKLVWNCLYASSGILARPGGDFRERLMIGLFRLIKLEYSRSMVLAAVNTFCGALFQLGILYKLGIGARSDLYFASISIPLVLYALAFGSFNNILVPMFVEAKASGGKESTLLWNSLLLVLTGGALLLVLLYYPALYFFSLVFHKLAWIDLGQVGKILLVYSAYQTLFCALSVKNCFLFSQGRPALAQVGVLSGWVVTIFLLSLIHPADNLWRIPLCLVYGNAVALVIPNLGHMAFHYRSRLFGQQATTLMSRSFLIATGTSLGWIEPVVDGAIASTLKQGSLTVYYFFVRATLYTITAIFSGYMQPVTKYLAELANSSRWSELKRQTRNVVFKAVLLGIGILSLGSVILLLLGIAKIPLWESYAAPFIANISILFLLMGYLFGAIGYVAYSNGMYILRRERLYVIASLAAFPMGICLKLSGAWLFGLKGLATGTSFYWILYALLLSHCFSRALNQRKNTAWHSTLGTAYQGREAELLE